jgi:FdhD protein
MSTATVKASHQPMTEAVTTRKVVKVKDEVATFDDDLVVEEPLEIRLDDTSLAVVMRTPGDDADLALGFAITEGIVNNPEAIADVVDLGEGRWNLVTESGVTIDPTQFQRNFYSTSSCGVCGKASIDAIRIAGARPPSGPAVTVETILGLPASLLELQEAFHSTGGLHAAAAFDASGDITAVREDVGRHNAVDKVVGWALAEGRLPLTGSILQVSGRLSFELVQKAWMAGIPVLSAVSAPSTLAVDLATEAGMTLAGFVRNGGLNVYAGVHRIDLASAHGGGLGRTVS